ncbi:MAG: hypothetical protein JEY91_15230, partial [Spirochaetaceae bacterium]|nr:hypothetical protein [Spirochaetaceae bacterium]
MVFFGKRNLVRSGRLVVFLLFILQSHHLFSQEEPRTTVEISPEKIIVGQRFDVTIFADFSSYNNVIIKEPRLPEGISLVGGPYKSAQTIRVGDQDNFQYIKKTRIFYKFKVSKSGIYS